MYLGENFHYQFQLLQYCGFNQHVQNIIGCDQMQKLIG